MFSCLLNLFGVKPAIYIIRARIVIRNLVSSTCYQPEGCRVKVDAGSRIVRKYPEIFSIKDQKTSIGTKRRTLAFGLSS